MKKHSNKSLPSQYELARRIRGSWNGVNPVTRVVPSGKLYKRNPKHRGSRYAG